MAFLNRCCTGCSARVVSATATSYGTPPLPTLSLSVSKGGSTEEFLAIRMYMNNIFGFPNPFGVNMWQLPGGPPIYNKCACSMDRYSSYIIVLTHHAWGSWGDTTQTASLEMSYSSAGWTFSVGWNNGDGTSGSWTQPPDGPGVGTSDWGDYVQAVAVGPPAVNDYESGTATFTSSDAFAEYHFLGNSSDNNTEDTITLTLSGLRTFADVKADAIALLATVDLDAMATNTRSDVTRVCVSASSLGCAYGDPSIATTGLGVQSGGIWYDQGQNAIVYNEVESVIGLPFEDGLYGDQYSVKLGKVRVDESSYTCCYFLGQQDTDALCYFWRDLDEVPTPSGCTPSKWYSYPDDPDLIKGTCMWTAAADTKTGKIYLDWSQLPGFGNAVISRHCLNVVTLDGFLVPEFAVFPPCCQVGYRHPQEFGPTFLDQNQTPMDKDSSPLDAPIP